MNQRLIICIIITLLTLFTLYICLFKTKPVDNLKKINQLPIKNFFDKTEIITVKNPIDGKNMLWVDNNFKIVQNYRSPEDVMYKNYLMTAH